MALRSVTPTSLNDPLKPNHPKPTDFDIFLPWACKEFSITADVVVARAAQKSYVSAAASKMKMSLKSKKQLLKRPSPRNSSDDMLKTSTFAQPEIDTENVINIETVYDDNLVQLKLLKNKDIPRKVMQTIALTIPYQQNVTSIIINGGLRMDSLYELSKFLPNSNITELCLDSTFLSKANYHILLTDSKIKHLSLARCTINDAVVKTITDQLKAPCPACKVLSTLNLSSNRITDVGANYIADMLRTNRQLSYLNLAGNMITDEGGINILDTLHEFLVHTQELLESRTRYIAYLKRRNDIMNTLITKRHVAKDKNPKKKMTKKPKLETQSLPYLSSQKRNIDLSVESQIMQEKAEYLAEKKLGLFNEPFSPNNTTSRDGAVYCVGNYTLCYLNIAYNNLAYASLKKLHEVLLYQKSHNITPRGLINVVIEGNLMPVACNEYEEIDHLLTSDVRGSKKNLETKRKHLTSRSSGNVTNR